MCATSVLYLCRNLFSDLWELGRWVVSERGTRGVRRLCGLVWSGLESVRRVFRRVGWVVGGFFIRDRGLLFVCFVLIRTCARVDKYINKYIDQSVEEFPQSTRHQLRSPTAVRNRRRSVAAAMHFLSLLGVVLAATFALAAPVPEAGISLPPAP